MFQILHLDGRVWMTKERKTRKKESKEEKEAYRRNVSKIIS